jgi:hypothetical protein
MPSAGLRRGQVGHPADGVFGSDKQSLPILIRVLDQVKLRIRSTPSQFALAQDALRRPFRSLERNLVLSHLIDGPALAGKEFSSLKYLRQGARLGKLLVHHFEVFNLRAARPLS